VEYTDIFAHSFPEGVVQITAGTQKKEKENKALLAQFDKFTSSTATRSLSQSLF